ncbi:zinc finger MYM-type protein 3-like [Babylonia areolata]|uniref:zinc finger MYM-type protein 3-like n=1 Tax=Babylonia areolata TaxID=304850 RepID=UPI003FD036DA
MADNTTNMNNDGLLPAGREQEALPHTQSSMEVEENEDLDEDDVILLPTEDQEPVPVSGDSVQKEAMVDGSDENIAKDGAGAGDPPPPDPPGVLEDQHVVWGTKNETDAGAMEPEEPEPEQAEGEKNQPLYADANNHSEAEHTDQENVNFTAVDSSELVPVETGDEVSAVSEEPSELRLMQENAEHVPGDEDQVEACNASAAREVEESALGEGDTGSDFPVSAEEENKLLGEDNVQSVQDDHGNTPVVYTGTDESAAITRDELVVDATVSSDQDAEQGTEAMETDEQNADTFSEKIDQNAADDSSGEMGNNSEVVVDSFEEVQEIGEKQNGQSVEDNAGDACELLIASDVENQDAGNLTDEGQDTGKLADREQDTSAENAAEESKEPHGHDTSQTEDAFADATAVKETKDEPMLQITDVKSVTDLENDSAGNSGVSEMQVKKEAESEKDLPGEMANTQTTGSSRETDRMGAKATPVYDDDDDDVVVLDEVPPPKVKQESVGKEVFNNNNEMGIQIASVSGGAEELHKMAELNQVKQENSGAQMLTLTNSSQKTPTVCSPPSSGPSPRKQPSKIQICIVCARVGKCKYNIVRNGDVKHLCDDMCFKRFRGNPSMYLKGTTTKQTTPQMPTRGRPAKNTSPGSTAPSKSSASVPAIKTCIVCQIMNVNNQNHFCTWKGMDFCGEGCLGKFQAGISTTCTLCKSFIPLTARSSNCLNVGNQIRPFCSSRCHSDYIQRRLCTYCQNDLASSKDSFSAPVGSDGAFKEFCSQWCMKQFESMLSADVEIIKVEQGKQRGSKKCSVCQKMEKTKHVIKYTGKVHNLCSDPCMSAFRYANKLDLKTCDLCFTVCSALEASPHMVVFEGDKKRFCSDACVSKYRFAHRKVVHCSWCGSQRDNFDMIERLDSSSKFQLFCSLNCLSLFRVNLQAKSNQAVKCDHCHKLTPAQYHLTMSDASVRNFCTYNCVMSFQAQFSKGQPPIPPIPPIPLSAVSSPATATAAKHRHNTRGKSANKNAQPAPTQSPVPIISNVISLAPQGSQTVNIKNSTGAPLVISGGTTPSGKASASTGTSPANGTPPAPQIIIQPPAPKAVKNKSLLCKPFTQTKATSCRPHAQSKECQTDKVEEKPALIPVPVPIYMPAPMAMYSAPAPTPIFIPIPIPVPVFIPTTRKSANGIMKQIQEIMDQTPSDPLEVELLQMAAAVSGEATLNPESDTDEETLPEVSSKSRKRSLPVDNNDEDNIDDDGGNADVMPLTNRKEDGEEDMLSMALRMAEEITDLEDAVQAVPVSSAPTLPETTSMGSMSEEPLQEDLRILRHTRRNTRGGGRGKRQRLQEPVVEQAAVPQQPVAPPPDTAYHLKFTYGVNAWRHWVMMKNAQIDQSRTVGTGRAKMFKTDILQCTADELNFSLCLFVKEVRKPNGDEYSPDSVYYLTLGLQQYLYENGRIDNIFADHYYEPFTKRLSEILSLCKPKFNSAGQMVCRIEEEHLWECKQLGAHSPYVLLNTLIYFHTKYFMLKTPEDHLKLSFCHILKYWKKGTAAVKGGQAPRSVSLRYYSVSSARKDASATVSMTKRGSRDGIPVYEVVENQLNPLRCPVKLYEFFLSKCPESIKNRSDIFYPVPERSCVPDSPVWYSAMPLSEEVMTRMLTRILLVREIQEAHLHAHPIFV